MNIFTLLPFSMSKKIRLIVVVAGVLLALNTSGLGALVQRFSGGATQPSASSEASAATGAAPLGAAVATAGPAVAADGESSEASGRKVNLDVLNLSEEPFDFRRDWWKYGIMLVIIAVTGYLIAHTGAQILRFLGLVFCLSFSLFLSYLLGPLLAPWLKEKVPALDFELCPPLYWAYLFTFLAAYLVAIIILRIIKRPIDITKPDENKKS